MKPKRSHHAHITPARLCSTYDLGGGVSLGDSFAIYSVVALPPSRTHIERESTLYAELESALSIVLSRLPIVTDVANVELSELASLPRAPSQSLNAKASANTKTNSSQSLPWFLINASKFTKHCILGQRTPLDSVLMILQRPWCVLELCCCDTAAIIAAYAFAKVATKIDDLVYSPAARLLSYELAQRDLQLERNTIPRSVQLSPWQADIDGYKPYNVLMVYADLSMGSLQSHQSFWIGLISSCAVSLGWTFSQIISLLGDVPLDIGNAPQAALSQPLCKQWYGPSPHQCALSLRYTRIIGYTRRPSCGDRNLFNPNCKSGHHLTAVALPSLDADACHIRQLLSLHAKMLRAIGDSIP